MRNGVPIARTTVIAVETELSEMGVRVPVWTVRPVGFGEITTANRFGPSISCGSGSCDFHGVGFNIGSDFWIRVQMAD